MIDDMLNDKKLNPKSNWIIFYRKIFLLFLSRNLVSMFQKILDYILYYHEDSQQKRASTTHIYVFLGYRL